MDRNHWHQYDTPLTGAVELVFSVDSETSVVRIGPVAVTLEVTSDKKTAVAVFTNTNTNDIEVGLASYGVYQRMSQDDSWIRSQKLHETQAGTVPAGGSLTLAVGLPGCAFQADAYLGQQPAEPPLYGDRLLKAVVDATEGMALCGENAATPTIPPTQRPPRPTFTPIPTGGVGTPTATPTPQLGGEVFLPFIVGPAPAPKACVLHTQDISHGYAIDGRWGLENPRIRVTWSPAENAVLTVTDLAAGGQILYANTSLGQGVDTRIGISWVGGPGWVEFVLPSVGRASHDFLLQLQLAGDGPQCGTTRQLDP